MPDPVQARKELNQIEKHTLGRLIGALRGKVDFEADLEDRFASALKARNQLNHGFYERHNFKIQSDEGRDVMFADLEELHEELFQAWQIASAMTYAMSKLVLKLQSNTSQELSHALLGQHVIVRGTTPKTYANSWQWSEGDGVVAEFAIRRHQQFFPPKHYLPSEFFRIRKGAAPPIDCADVIQCSVS